MSPTLTIDFKKRAEELRAEVRVLEEKGNLERAAWLQEIAHMFEQIAAGPPRQPKNPSLY